MFKELGALFLIFALGVPPVCGENHASKQAASSSSNQTRPNNQLENEAFWQRTTTDPVAFYTLVLAVFTIILALGTLSLWYVTWRTLVHAREDSQRQARDMQRANRASEKMIETSRRASKRELRAYVHLTMGERKGPHGLKMDFVLTFENAGQTPAHGVKSTTAHEFALSEKTLIKTPVKTIGVSSLGPRVELHTTVDSDEPLSEVELQTIESGQGAVFIHGRLSYMNAFGERCYTDFRLSYGKDNIADGSLSPCNEGNRAV